MSDKIIVTPRRAIVVKKGPPRQREVFVEKYDHKLAYAEPLHVTAHHAYNYDTVGLTNLCGSFCEAIRVYEPCVQTPSLDYLPSSMIERVVPRW